MIAITKNAAAKKPAPAKTTPKAPEKASEALQPVTPPAETETLPKAPKPQTPKRDRSTLYDTKYKPVPTHVVTVVPGCKGKKPGTDAGARWAVLAANSGKPLSDISSAYEKAGFKVKGTASLQSDMRWNLAHNLVTVTS